VWKLNPAPFFTQKWLNNEMVIKVTKHLFTDLCIMFLQKVAWRNVELRGKKSEENCVEHVKKAWENVKVAASSLDLNSVSPILTF
jgi:hypothetical protein